MMPDFWQGVHSVRIGSGAFEQMRNTIVLGGAGSARWLGRLLLRTSADIVLFAVVSAVLHRRERRADPAGEPGAPTDAALPPSNASAPVAG